MKQLAKELGVSPSYLSQVKNGKRPASQKVLSKVIVNVKQKEFDASAANSYNVNRRGPLAQLAEQLTLNSRLKCLPVILRTN